MSERKLIVGKASEVNVEKLYMLNVSLSGQDFAILVARSVAENGIKCLVGHDVLRAFEPASNFYHSVSEAIKKCDESHNSDK